jgi:hypothetical protein
MLEGLEARDCPSTITENITYGTGKTISVWGTLSDTGGPPGGQTVTISGMASGSTTTNSSGCYGITLTATALGNVYAKTADSNQASVTLVDTAPFIDTFTTEERPGDIWIISGHVEYDCHPEQLVINLAGIPSLQGKTVTVDAGGNWSLTIQLNGTSTDNGTISAVTTDPWGNASNTAFAVVYQTGT